MSGAGNIGMPSLLCYIINYCMALCLQLGFDACELALRAANGICVHSFSVDDTQLINTTLFVDIIDVYL